MNTAWILAALGFAMHFLARYGEYRRSVDKVGIIEYVVADWIAWISAVIGATASVLMLPTIGPALGLMANDAGYFVIGYMGSSLAAKLPGLLAPKVANSDQR